MITKIIVSGYELDLSENIAVPLNFSLQDFREPDKRKRSFSKSIVLEGTNNNMNFFISAFELNIDINNSANLKFNPTKTPECIVKKGDLIIFRGRLKLNQVNILNKVFSFDVTIFSDFVDVFTNLKNINLNELDWSEYDHELTRDNVINSWNSSVIKNGVVTSNFGADSRGYAPQSFGYIYPVINYGFSQYDSITYRTNQLFPYVYVKECVQKILDYAFKDTDIEVDYTTNFFTNVNMQKMIFGSGGGTKLTMSPAVITSAYFDFDFTKASKTISGTKYPGENLYTFFYNDYLLKDASIVTLTQDKNIYTVKPNTFLNCIKIGVGGYYKLTVSFDFLITDGFNEPGFTLSDLGNTLTVSTNRGIKGRLTQIQKSDETLNYSLTCDLWCAINDEIRIEFAINHKAFESTNTFSYSNLNITLSANSNQEATDNTVISLNNSLPQITCAEFLKGILNIFYATVSDPIYDPITNKRVVYINAFDDYYKDQNEYDDWSKKVDDLREINIECNSLIEGGKYNFQFNEEKDFFNNEYLRITGDQYGTLNLLVDTYQTEEKKYTLPFSTYPVVKIAGSDLRIPHILENNGTEIKPYKGKGQIAFYNGLRSGVLNIMNCANDTYTIKYDYPLTHHFRFSNANSYNPVFDLHFQSRLYTFDDITAYPDNNIFIEYIQRYINEITSVNSKLLRAYFKLNDNDISKMDFSKLKMINGSLFRLYSIKDYDDQNLGTTQCELIKFLE